ncbi:signal recognition particle-docking protein FtsY [Ectothiorhodospiraceae bacterium WFHF3C12]|nr:signal recognition particle-docking protein FtsY [Ectothiorhodospiraceae bacterium WFHF3C12]
MWGFKKKRKGGGEAAQEQPGSDSGAAAPAVAEEVPAEGRRGLFRRLRDGLGKTRGGLTEGLSSLVMGRKSIDDELLEELETRLLMADVGIEATQRIIDDLTARLRRKELADAEALFRALHAAMVEILQPCSRPLEIDAAKRPYVLLTVGINGAGKTTTIGKIANRLKAEGRGVMLAAGDTFRAAAVEQLKIWGERSGVPVIAQPTGSDSASVVFDAWQAAHARGTDVLIADTAGRLHTQSNLMEELKKIKRVLGKQDPESPHETMLVVDAGTGQNALSQAREFHEAVGLDSVALTKLDGTAKGGVIFAIAEQLRLPIRFIGVGEAAGDLRPFDAEEFVSALLDDVATEA